MIPKSRHKLPNMALTTALIVIVLHDEQAGCVVNVGENTDEELECVSWTQRAVFKLGWSLDILLLSFASDVLLIYDMRWARFPCDSSHGSIVCNELKLAKGKVSSYGVV